MLLTGRRRRRMIGGAAGVFTAPDTVQGGQIVCSSVHKAYFLKLLIREIRAAPGTWKCKGKGRGNVLGPRVAGGRQPAG